MEGKTSRKVWSLKLTLLPLLPFTGLSGATNCLINKELASMIVSPQAAQTYYVSLNEYINIHMDKLMR